MIRSIAGKTISAVDFFSPNQAVAYVNIFNYLSYRKSPQLVQGLDAFTLDGIALVLVMRFLGLGHFERISPDLSSYFTPLFEEMNATGKSLFVMGGKESELAQFKLALGERFPKIVWKGTRDGYTPADDKLFAHLKQEQPDVVLLGMGTPKQEALAVALKKEGLQASVYTCGAFISQTAVNKGDYYPDWVSRWHIRWMYRIYKDPKLFKRYAVDYPKGLICILNDFLFHKSQHSA